MYVVSMWVWVGVSTFESLRHLLQGLTPYALCPGLHCVASQWGALETLKPSCILFLALPPLRSQGPIWISQHLGTIHFFPAGVSYKPLICMYFHN